jgi:hypothetical protein
MKTNQLGGSVDMLMGGRRMQQPTIGGSDKGQKQQGSGRQRLALGDGGRQQKCQRLHDGGGQLTWMADDTAANNMTTNHHQEHKKRAVVGNQSGG